MNFFEKKKNQMGLLQRIVIFTAIILFALPAVVGGVSPPIKPHIGWEYSDELEPHHAAHDEGDSPAHQRHDDPGKGLRSDFRGKKKKKPDLILTTQIPPARRAGVPSSWISAVMRSILSTPTPTAQDHPAHLPHAAESCCRGRRGGNSTLVSVILPSWDVVGTQRPAASPLWCRVRGFASLPRHQPCARQAQGCRR